MPCCGQKGGRGATRFGQFARHTGRIRRRSFELPYVSARSRQNAHRLASRGPLARHDVLVSGDAVGAANGQVEIIVLYPLKSRKIVSVDT
jgi:hypothetical protein